MKGSVYSGGWIRTLLEYTGSAITLGDAKFRIGEGIVQLKLKEAAVGDSRLQVLSSLNAPFVVVKGTIKKIRLSVPWKHVFSQRCKIYFEGLEIHFAMLNDVGDMAHAPINSPMEASPRHGTPPEHATRSYMEAVEESHIPEGVEALTRLVQHILINLEVCLSDATVTLHPHGWVDGKLAGAHSDNNLGAPRIWLNAKELLIYSDTQTHHVPDASPRPTDAEEFPEIPDAPIDSKGISLLSMEVFVARDDQVSRLIHTGETPLRFGLRRVVGDSRDGRRSEADEDQIATLEVDVEVESVHINVDHESTLNVMSVLSESLEGEEKSVVEDEEENRMFYSVMETMMPPKPLSAAERTRIFWLEMYRLFDLDSKLEALCSGEDREEEEKKFMLGYAGPRDEESIQNLAGYAPPGEEFWFDTLTVHCEISSINLSVDFTIPSCGQNNAVFIGTLRSASLNYSWEPSSVEDGKPCVDYHFALADFSLAMKNPDAPSSTLERSFSFSSARPDGGGGSTGSSKDSAGSSSVGSSPVMSPSSLEVLEETFFERRGVHRLVEGHNRSFGGEKAETEVKGKKILYCDEDAISLSLQEGLSVGSIAIELDGDVITRLRGVSLPEFPRRPACRTAPAQDEGSPLPIIMAKDPIGIGSMSICLKLRESYEGESSRTLKILMKSLAVERNICRVEQVVISDIDGEDDRVLLETQTGAERVGAAWSLWRTSTDAIEAQLVLPRLAAPVPWLPDKIGTLARAFLEFTDQFSDTPRNGCPVDPPPAPVAVTVFVDRLSVTFAMTSVRDFDVSFRMCAFRLASTGAIKHLSIEAGEMYLGSVVRSWALRDLEATKEFPNSCEKVNEFVLCSVEAPSLRVEVEVPEQGAPPPRVIVTLKRQHGLVRASEIPTLEGLREFMDRMIAEAGLRKDAVESGEDSPGIFVMVEDCLVEGDLRDIARLAPNTGGDSPTVCRDIRAAVTFTGEANLSSTPPNLPTRTIRVHVAEGAAWLLDAEGCKLGTDIVLPSAGASSAGKLLRDLGYATIGTVRGATVSVTTPTIPDTHIEARIVMDILLSEITLCADSLACLSTLSTWISSLSSGPDDALSTDAPVLSEESHQPHQPTVEAARPPLCVIEDFDGAELGQETPLLTPAPSEEVLPEENWTSNRSEVSVEGTEEPAPTRRQTLDCYGGVETSTTLFAPFDGVLINREHFTAMSASAGNSSGANTPSEEEGRQHMYAPVEGLELRVTASQFEMKLFEGRDWSDIPGRSVSSSSGHIRASTRPKKPTICAGLKDVATTVVSKPLAAATSRQTSVWVGIGDVSIADLLEASVYQYLLVYYEGAKGEQPKAANVPLVLLRYDTSPGAQTKSDTQISHARVELSILPLRLTLDQDTLNWLDVFAENVNMHVYAAVDLKLMGDFEKEEVPEARGELVEARQAELEHLGSSALRTPKIPPSIWLDSFKISEVVACIDYRCKRVNLKRLRRGDRAELINLLPILEGLEVKLRSAHLRGLRNVTELSGQLIESWKGDMSKAQMLRSVCRMTPIRSLTNISCSLTELLSLPFLQYRYTSPIDSVARDPRTGRRLGWWRQLSEFATCLTIESLTALERAVSTTQSVLETASDLVDATAPSSLVSSSSADWTAVECVDDRDSDSASQRHLTSGSMADDDDDEWLSVGRGAVRDRHFAPSSGVEQLQFITQRLSRDIQNTGRDALIAPLQDYAHGRASTESVVVSVARGVPLCILRPAAGATEAVSVALRTATSSLDKGQAEKERERKFKGPGIV